MTKARSTGKRSPGSAARSWPLLMGVARWAAIAARLQEGGLSGRHAGGGGSLGYTPGARTVRATLATLEHHRCGSAVRDPPGQRRASGPPGGSSSGPCLGRAWWGLVHERRRRQLARRLVDLGAEPVEAPVRSRLAKFPRRRTVIRSGDTVARLPEYDWLVPASSPNGVQADLCRHSRAGEESSEVSVSAAIGPGTAEALAGSGSWPISVPKAIRRRGAVVGVPVVTPERQGRVLLACKRRPSPTMCSPTACGAKSLAVDVVQRVPAHTRRTQRDAAPGGRRGRSRHLSRRRPPSRTSSPRSASMRSSRSLPASAPSPRQYPQHDLTSRSRPTSTPSRAWSPPSWRSRRNSRAGGPLLRRERGHGPPSRGVRLRRIDRRHRMADLHVGVARFAEFGHELPLETWATIVGLTEGEGGWYDTLKSGSA